MTERRPSRRRFLAFAAGTVASGLAGCLGRDTGTPAVEEPTPTVEGPTPTNGSTTPTVSHSLPDEVGLETIVSDVDAPIDVVFLSDRNRRYLATKGGRVLVHDPDGTRDEPLLDLRDVTEWGYEMGLLGIAVHPRFPDDRRLFVRYSAALRDDAPDGYDHTFVLSEFEVSDDGTRADRDSERTILEIPQPHANHNSGSLAFGPEGYLYVGTGDGGGVSDTGHGHVDDWYGGNEGGNGQDTTENLLGGVLRIDVDDRDGGRAYGIPDDNPLVDRADHLDEYYAWGFRNPWGISFDDDRFFVADVGQGRWEEVNLVEKGGNYGWNVREGSHCFDADDRFGPGGSCPDALPRDVRGGEPLVSPILEYPHHEADEVYGSAVVGGFVYRGGAIPELEGRYLFGDLEPDGRLFVGIPSQDGAGEWSAKALPLTDDDAADLDRILRFGRDAAGDVYVLGGGGVHKVVPG